MLDKNITDNQAKLRKEVSDIKKYLSLIEREINSSDDVRKLSDWQLQDMWKRLKTISNFTFNANYFLAKYTNNKELKKKLGIYKFAEEVNK